MREAFEQAILEAPDDVAAYSAFADWLIEHGDPQGEFVRVQLALEDESLDKDQRAGLKRREMELLARHNRDWLGPLAAAEADYRFARGFLDGLHVGGLRVDTARALRDAPAVRFLRELVIDSPDYPEDRFEPGDDLPKLQGVDQYDLAMQVLLQRDEYPGVRRLRIGPDIDMDAYLDGFGADCHTYVPAAADLVERMPRLEELHLLCKSVDLDRVFRCRTLTRLRVLRVYHANWAGGRGERYEYPLDALAANPALGNLTHLMFHPHYIEGRGDASYLPLDQVRAVLRSPHLPNLTHLQLRLSNMGDDGCRELVESGALRRLRWLDVRHGRVTDAGARVLAACPDLRHLEHLDLSRNGLTAAGVAALRATGVSLRADYQQTPEELAEHQYLREGDFE